MKQQIPVFAYTIAACRLQTFEVKTCTTHIKNEA